MSYTITFTETNNPDKQPITVQDGTINTSTSLQYVGKNYSGYAPIIAGDFLHLLENFANNTAPANPVQGQLWYDNSDGINLLYAYDGTTWNEVGSVKKSGTAPSSANAGDLWVDTINSQLYLYSGSAFVLVGPQFSSGLQSGPIIETIVDTNNISHTVTTLYATSSSNTSTSYRLAIISKDSFTPKSTVLGFTTINEGINLSSVDSTNTNSLTRFWGTAQQSDALLVGTSTVPAANFLRSDVTSISNYPINVRNDGGITLGAGLGFNIGVNGTTTVLYSKNSGNAVEFATNNGGRVITSMHLNANARLGLGTNNANPQSTLDVIGGITASDDTTNAVPGRIVVKGTSDVGTTSTGSADPGGASIQTLGGLSTALSATIGTTLKVVGTSTGTNGAINVGADSNSVAILPSVNASYDIGSSSLQFRNIYAQTFNGNFAGTFTGTVTGSVSGSAAKLTSPTTFLLTGDVTSPGVVFDGQTTTGTLTFTTSINSGIISAKTAATDSALNDQLLVLQASTGNLVSMTKSVLFNHVATVPIGSIFPYAGVASNLPAGYLLCDGSEVQISKYPALYAVLQYTYKASSLLIGLGTFALPDLRGRFPLGADNMNNGLTVRAADGSGIQLGAGGGSANRVSNVTADVVGASDGSQNVTLSTTNLPDHKHSLSDGYQQFYAVGAPNPTISTAEAQKTDIGPGYGLTAQNQSGQGYGLSDSGSVSVPTAATATPLTTMNPYLTINYIIFTGVI
jgi:microcystin-dependent protein